MSGNTTTVAPTTAEPPIKNDSTSTFVVALIINGIIALVVLLIYSLLRPKPKAYLCPASALGRKEVSTRYSVGQVLRMDFTRVQGNQR